MISTQQTIYCVNPDCQHPINSVGNRVCAHCQTPLVHRYLWATGSLAAKIPPNTHVAHRYEVITQQIWLDTQPGLTPDVPEDLPQVAIPYLKLYQQQLHIPQPYGFTRLPAAGADDILLLENAPIDHNGRIYPTLADAWMQASAVRQVYWLWQILQLWSCLSELGIAHSLLIAENLRVQGWCVRLLELYPPQSIQPTLRDLGQSWQPGIASAKISVAPRLKNILQQMSNAEVDFAEISNQLNALLLSSAAELPLNLEVAGATDTGRELKQNEDACYPNSWGNLDDPLATRLAMVCDGIGGHQGGEVASQLALRSLKLQIQALLAEVAAQTELVPPDLLGQQLEASLRVVNNVISARNDEQKRQGRERMATTLVMGLQLPQQVEMLSGQPSENAHELYLANVGDSRAYWITRNYCQRLTVDDDVAMREVRLARSLYRQALQKPDAAALTQALGTKDAETLRLSVQRFILEEDGILLLCSDGLSDNDWVEQSWQDYAVPVLTGKLALEDAVRNWINLANQKNGHDNTSLVMTYCSVSREYLVSMTHLQLPVEIVESDSEIEFDLVDTPPVVLDVDITAETAPSPVKKSSRGKQLSLLGGILVLLLGGAGLALFAWLQVNPQGLQRLCQQLPQKVQQLCLPKK
ncbi:4-Cys prefix domain-containing protein [Fortiea contorta]|uniref:4-Cys prefix domain-containing protein n=1 Tax=Fortiea contorta TaxID=1892405 RepID=UPI00034D7751|nr:4-Cys prefix domain-containing protein [Fortiea contorta]